jgi:hypothetical protein
MSNINTIIQNIEQHPLPLVFAVFLSNMGYHFIADDLSDKHREMLNTCYLRKLYLFALIYCGTRNIMVSLVATLLYALIINWI